MPGVYTVTETATAGWGLSSVACAPFPSETTPVVSNANPLNINVPAGQTIKCTYTNSRLAALGDRVPPT